MLVRDLGLRDYEEVWNLQRKLVFERGEGKIPDTVLLCQHPSVYTIGRSSKQPVPEALPYPLFKVERGEDPIGVIRDPNRNQRIDLPNEKDKKHFKGSVKTFLSRTHVRFSPVVEELGRVYEP